MKYIVLRVEYGKEVVREMPIIFPEIFVHRQVAELFEMHLLRVHNAGKITPVSAGEIHSMSMLDGSDGEVCCYGESETLKLKSRGKQDDALITAYNYNHGIVE